MIIILLGGIGSGKSVSVVKEIYDNRRFLSLTNFKTKKMKQCQRLKISDILIKAEKQKDWRVNWAFWDLIRKQNEKYSIYLDEVHNLIHARSSMSKTNILMSKWISQIRKILSDHPINHLYLISQSLRKIDIDFRELAQIFIQCNAVQKGKNVYILQKYYEGINNYELGRSKFKKYFHANPYFKFYDSLELISFSDAEEYI